MASENRGDLRIHLDAFTFFKDNEYFNNIIEGYTLFGSQVHPKLVYYPTEKLRLEAGVFLWQDFGNAKLRQAQPTFTARYRSGPHEIVLGNIRGHLHHGYIEPLFNFERVILKRVEEGLQYRYLGNRFFVDAWVDWLRQQYRSSNYQEQIAGGFSSELRLTGAKSPVAVFVPLQFTATHTGGQIDTLDKPLQTLFNGAAGLGFLKRNPHSSVQRLHLQAYVLGYQDRSFTYQLPFRRGSALYLNAGADTRWLDALVSYWHGHKFVAPLGGDLYQSVSRTVNTPSYTEDTRQLLFVRLMRDFSLGHAAAITVRLEPVYDFRAKSTEFSAGVYLNFRQEWLLGNVGNRVRWVR
ncbi:hypothetical protein [Hymenobacter latericus]|uniref:hypothetical protein n=1 Tax=Hymenobacter sp. YIM 151858-1 TaxID=2987688 RepID=UPI0022266B4A|nr:hypothetical protein [Hymenobacter sp. YIM 151858-1]UYZ58992.1 hypothetical protein OIS50_18275 [Hymenobacter sp. YIM 151858-1]